MAKFQLQEGEKVIERARARDLRGDTKCSWELILTDRRIVVTRTRTSDWAFMFGFLGGLLGAAFSDSRLEYQVSRAELASATATSAKELSVVSTGEGYAITRFDLKLKDAAAWADRLHRWAAGAPDAEMPRATVVKRD
jgi:hypothetical protein